MLIALFWIIFGLVVLVGGGEMLVRGAVMLATKAKVAPLFIGLVVIGFGTSMPEFATAVEAVMAGSPQIAWGNIVGSNTANTLLILGAAALVAPIAAAGGRRRLRDPAVGLLAAILLFAIAVTEVTVMIVGVAMLLALIGYIVYSFKAERNAPEEPEPHFDAPPQGWSRPVILTIAGLALLIVGGQMLVTGAIDLARIAGMSETMIGLTIVAIGTSLPELVASVAAARKGEAEVALGNVAGSNLFNILLIGGTTMLLSPEPLPGDLWPANLGVMTAAAALLVILVAWRRGVSRAWGAALLACYAAYLLSLALSA